jgi:hypothetical protein
MARSKSHKSSEVKDGLIRQLKSENKSLKQRIRQLERHFQPEEQEEEETTEEFHICPACKEGTLSFIDIVGRIFEVCDHCHVRRKVL